MKSISSEHVKQLLKKVKIVSLYRLNYLYLKDSGWLASTKVSMPVDSKGIELPWFTYSIIQFLEARLKPDFSVFEFGSGNSTIWLSRKVAEVCSVEHDKIWFDKFSEKLLNFTNVRYLYRPLEDNEYDVSVLDGGNRFDIIIIDGRDRISCAINSIQAIKESGVIIWDNSDRKEYNEGYEFLAKQGFKRIDFWGMGPVNAHGWCTTVFYRDNNCLEI